MTDESQEPAELSAEQIEELRTALMASRAQLEQRMELSAESSKPVELDQASVGRVSRIDAIGMQQMSKANRRNTELRLGQIAQALRRMQSDDYGFCIRCEEPIGYRRLQARPETPTCLNCQSATERTQRNGRQ